MSHHHHPTTRHSTSNDLNETMKKVPSPRRQTTRSTSNLTKELLSTSPTTNEQCIQVIKPVAVRPPSSDSSHNPYNLRSRTKLKNSMTNNNNNTEVIPSFTEKLSLETQLKPVPPLTRAAAASAGVKIDSFLSDECIKTNNKQTASSSSIPTRSAANRKRKASDDDHRPYLDLLKMKQVSGGAIPVRMYVLRVDCEKKKRIRSTLMEFRASSGSQLAPLSCITRIVVDDDNCLYSASHPPPPLILIHMHRCVIDSIH